jgi:vanillate O-demethylase ferredoxin subunit
MSDTIEVRVRSVTWETEAIRVYDLRRPDGGPLPHFEPGAHIDLHVPGGLVRSYSLVEPPGEPHCYRVAVAREATGRGGSRRVHEALQPGTRLGISAPRNNFPLVEDAPHSLLIAGGIGITPILCMARRLAALRRSWRMFYAARSRDAAAFLDVLAAWPDRVTLHLDDSAGGPPGLPGLIAAQPEGTHLYCCGPAGMLAAFQAATAGMPPERVHLESFTPLAEPAAEGGFTVELARSGRSIRIDAGQTILGAVLAAGIEAPHSCQQGICGACETKVLSGTPDHRDSILSAAERDAGTTMMICCSGAKTPTLVLDL